MKFKKEEREREREGKKKAFGEIGDSSATLPRWDGWFKQRCMTVKTNTHTHTHTHTHVQLFCALTLASIWTSHWLRASLTASNQLPFKFRSTVDIPAQSKRRPSSSSTRSRCSSSAPAIRDALNQHPLAPKWASITLVTNNRLFSFELPGIMIPVPIDH